MLSDSALGSAYPEFLSLQCQTDLQNHVCRCSKEFRAVHIGSELLPVDVLHVTETVAKHWSKTPHTGGNMLRDQFMNRHAVHRSYSNLGSDWNQRRR